MPLQAPPQSVVDRYYPQLVEFIRRLDRLALQFPAWRATSWYRSPGRNVEVGGAPLSQHTIGLAADVVGPREQVGALLRAARAANLVALDELDHVHLQFFAASSNPLRRPV